MMILSKANIDKYIVEVYCIILIILLYLFRTAIPLFKYPFLLLYLSFFLYSLITYKDRFKSTLIGFTHNYSLILLLAIIIFISFLLSNKLYLTVFKDLVSTIILLSIFFFLFLVITTKREFNFFVHSLIKFIIFFALLISIYGLFNFFNTMSDSEIHSISKIRGYLISEFNLIDNNFALLPLFFGMVGVFYFLNKTNSAIPRVIYNLLLLIYSVNILFSGSRRGLFVLFVIVIMLLVAQIMTLLTKNNFFKKLSSNSYCFLLSIIFLTFISYAFIFHTSYSFKYKTLEFISVKNVYLTKEKITRAVFSYVLPLRKNITYSDINNIIWPFRFDPKDPDSGWGTRNQVHGIIMPIHILI